MIIKNGNVFQEDGSFRKETLYIRNHRLTEAFEATAEEEVIDAEGLMVIPGLVDIHSHGAYGEDFSDGDPEGLKKILRYERQSGITSYCPTSMTLPKERDQGSRKVRRWSNGCRYQYGRTVSGSC